MIAKEENHKKVEIEDILVSLSENDAFFENLLIQVKLKEEDIKNISSWFFFLREREERSKKFWLRENLMKNTPIAKDWTKGYTVTLDQYSTDWTEIIQKKRI